ncbi:MAG: c-type cytochrome [Myxococcales bacterium]|nr:c-type cytochrome [Myxococcales bacterium]
MAVRFVRLGLVLMLASCGNSGSGGTQQQIPFGGGGAGGGSGGPSGTCTPAARTCQSLTELSTCDAAGTWQTSACPAGERCEDGECAEVICMPGKTACDGANIVRCSARATRTIVQDVCAGNDQCIGGVCVGKTCSIGETACVGNAVVSCTSDAEWFKKVCAVTETCVVKAVDGGAGTPTCVPHVCVGGTASCKDGKAVVCSADGLSQQVVDDCTIAGKAGEARACLAGKCTPAHCTAGAKQCAGGSIATCKDDFSGWTQTPCSKDMACDDTAGNVTCKKSVCIGHEVFCDGLNVMKCNATGTSKKKTHACNGNLQECKNGGCTDLAIVCGDGFCDEGESLENCPKDCKEKITVSPDFDKVPTTVVTDKPRAPRGLTQTPQHASYTSSTMAVGGKWLYVVDRDNGALVLMDRLTLAITHTLKVGGRPENVLVGPTGRVWVSVRDDDLVLMLKPGATTLAGAAKWPVGFEPMGLALVPGGKMLLVTLFGDAAVVGVDTTSGTVIARANVKPLPRSVAVGTSGKAAVTHGSGLISAIDVKLMQAGNVLIPAIVPALFTSLRVSNPVKVCRGIVLVAKRAPNRNLSIALHPETGVMLMPHVLVNGGTAEDVLASAGVKPKVKKPKPKKVTVCSSGGYGSTCKTVMVTPPGPNPPPPCISAPVRPYEVSVSALSPALTIVNTTTPTPVVIDPKTKRSFLARFDQPSGIVHHPTMTMAFIAASGTNNVLVINTAAADPMRWPIADIAVGMGPKSVVVSPDGKTAWVQNATDFTVSAIDLSPLLAFNDPLTQGSAMPKIAPLFLKHSKQVAYAKDPLSAKMALGRRVFHNAMNGRLSASNRFACATCHLDGMEDKRVWFVAEGPRQTPALAGRLKDTAPYNWMGSKYALQDSFKATTTRMGGTGLMPAELAGLEAFAVHGLVPPRNPNLKPGGLTAQQLEGKKLFYDPVVSCTDCHTGPGLTDAAQHDVGTATPVEVKVQSIFAGNDSPNKVVYNTPSLRGLFYTAPYLHDGSAATLKIVLQKTAKTMGKTSHLTDKQLDALVAYLLTL